mmetsp:Transcript_1197/g.1895  ORF Transcript_1197/g.1895 Transcript_1197/m.1895 type:complete len:96 (-) Transcript_1197:85-372(-)
MRPGRRATGAVADQPLEPVRSPLDSAAEPFRWMCPAHRTIQAPAASGFAEGRRPRGTPSLTGRTLPRGMAASTTLTHRLTRTRRASLHVSAEASL